MSTMIKKYDNLKIGTRILFFKDMRPYTGMVFEKMSNIIKLIFIRGEDRIPGLAPYGHYCDYGIDLAPVEIPVDSDWYPTGQYEVPIVVSDIERKLFQSIMHSCVEPTNMSKVNIDKFFELFPPRQIAITPSIEEVYDSDLLLPYASTMLKTSIHLDADEPRTTRFVSLEPKINQIDLYVVRPVWIESEHKSFIYLKNLTNPHTYLTFNWLNVDYTNQYDNIDVIDIICKNEGIDKDMINDLTFDADRDERSIESVWELSLNTILKYGIHTDDYREIYNAKDRVFVDRSYLTRVL